jgi:hypothetical protein
VSYVCFLRVCAACTWMVWAERADSHSPHAPHAPHAAAGPVRPVRPLMRVLRDTAAYDCLLTFCKAEFAAENILFWKAIEDFRAAAKAAVGASSSSPSSSSPSASPSSQCRSLLNIWSTFVRSDAPLQVNLSAHNQLLAKKRVEHFFTAAGAGAEAVALREEAAESGLDCTGGQGPVRAVVLSKSALSPAAVRPLSIEDAKGGDAKGPGSPVAVHWAEPVDPELVPYADVYNDAAREIFCVMVRYGVRVRVRLCRPLALPRSF